MKKVEIGDLILASLPEKRQPIKWWRISRPVKFGHRNFLNKSWKVNLPRFSYSRTYVGLLFIHFYLFNRWCFVFHLGRYNQEDYLAKGGKQVGLEKILEIGGRT